MRMMNKLVVVTAAASRMGRAGAEICLKKGARVAAVDVNAEGLAHLAADLAQKGQKIETIQADLSMPADIRGAINQAASKLGGIDVLWAHAGSRCSPPLALVRRRAGVAFPVADLSEKPLQCLTGSIVARRSATV